MKEIINNSMKKNWLYLFLVKPKFYFFTLFKHTLFVGIITLTMSYLYFNSSYTYLKIPTITHTLISVAIGLLLVFRTQTAYDRWFMASKHFYDLIAYFDMLFFRLESLLNDEDKKQYTLLINNFCDNFQNYLIENNDDNLSNSYENNYLISMNQLVKFIETKINQRTDHIFVEKPDINFLMKIITDILLTCSSLARIKNTPIPISYEIHIKISIFFYICSLPFGLFYDMGLWSVLMVMLVYYIMAGIEIISKEIENPFYGDPNDLPVADFIKKVKGRLI